MTLTLGRRCISLHPIYAPRLLDASWSWELTLLSKYDTRTCTDTRTHAHTHARAHTRTHLHITHAEKIYELDYSLVTLFKLNLKPWPAVNPHRENPLTIIIFSIDPLADCLSPGCYLSILSVRESTACITNRSSRLHSGQSGKKKYPQSIGLSRCWNLLWTWQQSNLWCSSKPIITKGESFEDKTTRGELATFLSMPVIFVLLFSQPWFHPVVVSHEFVCSKLYSDIMSAIFCLLTRPKQDVILTRFLLTSCWLNDWWPICSITRVNQTKVSQYEVWYR